MAFTCTVSPNFADGVKNQPRGLSKFKSIFCSYTVPATKQNLRFEIIFKSEIIFFTEEYGIEEEKQLPSNIFSPLINLLFEF